MKGGVYGLLGARGMRTMNGIVDACIGSSDVRTSWNRLYFQGVLDVVAAGLRAGMCRSRRSKRSIHLIYS